MQKVLGESRPPRTGGRSGLPIYSRVDSVHRAPSKVHCEHCWPWYQGSTTETISIYIVGCTVHCIVEKDDDRGRMDSAPLSRQRCTRVHCLSRMPISTTSSFADGALRVSLPSWTTETHEVDFVFCES
jgi:hypothetical protein